MSWSYCILYLSAGIVDLLAQLLMLMLQPVYSPPPPPPPVDNTVPPMYSITPILIQNCIPIIVTEY